MTSANRQSHGIVLAIARIRESNLASKRSEECSRCTESIYAKGIITAVSFCPFVVTDESGWQCFKLKVAHSIAADNHARLLFMKGIDNGLQRRRR